jgi:hypothetical protein
MLRSITCVSLVGLVVSAATAGCSGQDSPSSASSQATEEADSVSGSVEDPKQYEDCLVHGRESSVNLAGLAYFPNPPTKAVFEVAECIVGHLTDFQGKFRPYHLQSYKTRSVDNANATAATTFFFKRFTENSSSEPPPQCLKVKLDAKLGATDFFVTIKRVKQLPSTTPNGLCSDNGEN